MGAVVLRSKLTPPELPNNHLARPHLLATLNTAWPHNTTFIVAGPGYGKSTLLAEWVSLYQNKVWYSLDQTDRDPVVFFAYLLAGFRDIWPDFGQGLDKQLLAPASLKPDAFALALLGEIESSLEGMAEPVAVSISLDDFHSLADRPEIHESVQLLIERMPKGVCLGIASRRQPPFSLNRLVMTGKLHILSEEQLRYDADEMEALLPDRDMLAEENKRLIGWAQGWPFGIRLILNSLIFRPHLTEAGEKESARSAPLDQIFDYLAQELLKCQPEILQRFLIQTSILESVTSEACNEIFERDDGEEKLQTIKERNLFVEHKHDTFKYHPLFKTFLRNQFAVVSQEEQRQNWGRRAATYYRKQGQWIPAFNQAMEIGAEDMAAEILLEGFTFLRSSGYWESLQSCFQRLSQDTFDRLPSLWVMQGFLWEDNGLHAQANGAFRQAIERAGPDDRGVLVRAWLGLGIVQERTGDISAAREAFERAAGHAQGADARVRYMAQNALGMIELSSGHYPGALDAFKNCQELSATLGGSIQAQAMNNLGAATLGLGDFTTARHWFEKSLAFRKEAQETPGIVSCLGNLSFCSLRLGYAETAICQVDEALALGGVGFHPAMQAVLLSNKGDALVLQGNLAEAEACYRESLEKREALDDRAGLVHIWTRFGALRRIQGNLDEALACLRRAETFLKEGYIGLSARLPALLELAATLLAREELEEAEALLSEVIEAHRNVTGDRFGLASALFYLAALQNAANRPPQAALKESLALAAAHGYEFRLGVLFREQPELLPIAIAENIEPSLIDHVLPGLDDVGFASLVGLLECGSPQGQFGSVERMLALNDDRKWQYLLESKDALDSRAKDLLETAIQAILQTEPEPLHVTTFGQFSLKRGEHQIETGDWINRKAESLFKILLGRQGTQVDRLDLIGMLWPEALPDHTTDKKYRVGFNNLFSRLRKVLEPYLPDRHPSRYVREANHSYGLYLPSGSWVDFLAFKAALERGDQYRSMGNMEEAIDAYEEALDLYRGDYMVEDSYDEWCLRQRERFQLRAVSASFEIVRYFSEQGNFYRVVSEGGRLMTLEPWNERGCFLLVDALLKLGRKKAAGEAYQGCKASLREEVGIADSPELDEIAGMYGLA